MKRLGYKDIVAQGGDWGALIVDLMGRRRRRDCSASTRTWPARFRRKSMPRPSPGQPPPPGLSAEEKQAFDQLAFFYKHGLGYAQEMGTARRRCTASRIRLSAWPPGSSTTTSELRADRSRLRRAVRGPDARRHSRQHHPLLADEHGGFLGASLLGEQAGLLCPEGRRHPGGRERRFRMKSVRPRGVGPKKPTPS